MYSIRRQASSPPLCRPLHLPVEFLCMLPEIVGAHPEAPTPHSGRSRYPHCQVPAPAIQRESVTSPLTTFIISVRRLSRSEIASASSIGTTFRSCSSSAIKCVLTRSLLKITSSRSADCPNKRCRASSPPQRRRNRSPVPKA